MKKATVIIVILGLLVSVTAYAFIKLKEIEKEEFYSVEEPKEQKEEEEINENEERAKALDESNDSDYHYTNLDLDKKQYVAVNDCMQLYLENEDFVDANNCEEQIVDAIVAQGGERNFVKSVMGHMLSYYKDGVQMRFDYLRGMIMSSDLDDNLVYAFLNKYRNPRALSEIYNNHKAYFFNYISKNVYDKVYKKTIDSFLNSYEEIHNQADREAFYEDIYFKADTQNKQAHYWEYTFWKRRELEKNDAIIHQALKEISAHYLEE